jgi:hypothetical protein
MDRLSFDIFIPEKKFRFTPNWIVTILWGVTLGFFWIFDHIVPPNGTFGIIWLVCVFLVSLYYMISSFFTYEPLKGIMKGKIIFEKTSIVIDEKIYELKDITGIDFGFVDYYGGFRSISGANFNPLLSQGVNNFIEFKDNSKAVIRTYFRIQSKHGSMTLYPFINDAVECGAMTYYRAIDLIDVENVRKPAASQ